MHDILKKSPTTIHYPSLDNLLIKLLYPLTGSPPKGDPSRIVPKGDPSRIVPKGDPGRIVSKGDPSKVVPKGDPSKIVTKGDSLSRISSV